MEPEHNLPMIFDAANLLLKGTDKSAMAYQRTAQLCGRLCVSGKAQYVVVVPMLTQLMQSMHSRGRMLATTGLSLVPATTQHTGQVPTVADLQHIGLDRTQAQKIQGLFGKGAHIHLVLDEDEEEDYDDEELSREGVHMQLVSGKDEEEDDDDEDDEESDEEDDNNDGVDSNDDETDDENDDVDDDSEEDDVQRPSDARDRAQAARNPPIRLTTCPWRNKKCALATTNRSNSARWL